LARRSHDPDRRDPRGGRCPLGQVVELPGCFATGDDLDELAEALGEAIVLYQSRESAPAQQPTPARGQRYRVGRMTLVDA
jgi:predicted RNase H-like HicB family nuclease